MCSKLIEAPVHDDSSAESTKHFGEYHTSNQYLESFHASLVVYFIDNTKVSIDKLKQKYLLSQCSYIFILILEVLQLQQGHNHQFLYVICYSNNYCIDNASKVLESTRSKCFGGVGQVKGKYENANQENVYQK